MRFKGATSHPILLLPTVQSGRSTPVHGRFDGRIRHLFGAERPGARRGAQEELDFLRRKRGGADDGQRGVLENELDGASPQRPDPRALAAGTQQIQVPRQVAQMTVDPQRAGRLSGESVEVLVARERARLLLEALDEPVEELAHAEKLPPQARENRLDFQGRGRAVRAIRATISSPAAPRQTSSPQANSITRVLFPSAAS